MVKIYIFNLVLAMEVFISTVSAEDCTVNMDDNKIVTLASGASTVMKCSNESYLFSSRTVTCSNGEIVNMPVCLGSILLIGGAYGNIRTGIFFPDEPGLSYIFHGEDFDNPVGSFQAQDGRIFVIGGFFDNSDLTIYTPESMEWVSDVSVPDERMLASGELIDSHFYYCGGMTLTGEINFKNCNIYDIDQNMWLQPDNRKLNQERTDSCSFVLDKTLYLIGGGSSRKTVEYLETNIPNSNWTYGVEFPGLAESCGATAIGEIGYVCGGYTASGQSLECYKFTKADNQWNQIASMNEGRRQFRLEAFDGKLYAILGMTGNTYLTTIEWYDPDEADQWNIIEGMSAALGKRAEFVIA